MSLQDYRPMMERCSMCLSCRWIPYDKIQSQRFGENCPSIGYYNFSTNSARGRFQLSQSILDGRTSLTDTVVETIHSCTACGACDTACKVTRYNLELLDHNLELKAHAVSEGKILPSQEKIMDSLKKERSMIPGALKSERMDWAGDLELIDVFKEEADVVFFAGCKYSYDPALQEIARSNVSLLQKAGVRVGALGAADNCCSGRALQMGFREEYEKHAESNIKAMEKAGVKRIVTPCSDCYHAFKRQYPKAGLKAEVLHIVEYIDLLIKEGKIKFTKSVPLTVTYHDPCHLGRLGEEYIPWNGREKKILNQVHTWEPRRPRYTGTDGIYDAPRNILASIPGVQLAEMERIREYAWCCGAGGGCGETLPEFSSWTAEERLTEAKATGADVLVTACPWCVSSFTRSADKNGGRIKVLDIIELVRQAI
ncbi:MAG TPA: (Fe-S)-binding protein [Anaerovoracaceae bacterium]|nr:(Fe-S)-binding protein [Anaerovoracaceae bacterium]